MAKAKQKEPTYYKVDDKTWNSGVKEGVSITVQRIMLICLPKSPRPFPRARKDAFPSTVSSCLATPRK